MKKNIPNIITLCNLLSGCVACFLAINNDNYMVFSAYFILLAAVFDFFDGFAARALKAYSELGKQLDSLADLISFGIAPAAIMSMLIRKNLNITGVLEFSDMVVSLIFLIFIPFILTAFSALRLAKFNIDTRQTSSFIGMPTPANALFIVSLVFMSAWGDVDSINMIFLSTTGLVSIVFINSYLLVSPIPMFSLKFKNYGFKENKLRYIFLILALLLFVLIAPYALTLTMILYVVLSIFESIVNLKKQ